MPPASPVPGWSIGDVCTLMVATRLTRRRNTDTRTTSERVITTEIITGFPDIGETGGP
ncbi:hypothetical protein GCM10027612_18880 [Microbispora bryophytorum subsp. camponoti]